MSVQSGSDIDEFEQQQQANADEIQNKQARFFGIAITLVLLGLAVIAAWAAWLSVGGGL